MKKVLPIVAVLLALGIAAFVFLQRRQAESRVRATALAPADTVVFVHFPDVRQSAIRWPKTALAQIGAEPEMQAFLERPRTKIGWFSSIQTRIDQITHAAPREGFAAITSLEGSSPRYVAGFSFSGSRSAVEEALADARASLRRAWPTGKADVISYAGAEIETYSDKENTVAETIRDGWYLVSSQVELLEATLDRLDGKPGASAALTSAALFQQVLAPQPADADAVVFARLDLLSDKLTPMLAAAGQPASQEQLSELRKNKALSATIRFDGELIRDSLFILNSEEPKAQPLARRGLDLSSAETLLYYAFTLPTTLDLQGQTTLPLGMLFPALAPTETALEAKGLKLVDFGAIFGPEVGVLVDWAAGGAQPSFLVGVDVRDSVKARDFLDAVAQGQQGAGGWKRKEAGNAVIYSVPQQGLLPSPVLALEANFLIVGFSEDAISSGLQHLVEKNAPLAKTAAYQQAIQLVKPPTDAFGYLDTKRLFERAYGILRPVVAMALAFSPEMGETVDIGKLPSAEVISRHLVPSVYSQSNASGGTLIESAGTLTFNQALLGTFAGAGAAAFPALKQAFPSGAIPPGLLPPGVQPPAAPTAPAPPATPPADSPTATPTPATPAPATPAPATSTPAVPGPEAASTAPAVPAAEPSPAPAAGQ